MGLFGKKKEEKSILPDIPETTLELPKLPEFNDSAVLKNENYLIEGFTNKDSDLIKEEIYSPRNISEPMQKSTFDPLPRYNINEIPEKIVADPSYVFNTKEKKRINFIEPKTFEISEGKYKNFNEKNLSSVKDSQPVYIKLDSFKLSLESFEDIKNKVVEIEDLLSKIKETKDREERELSEWEREIQILKARIEQINRDIFKSID